MFFYYLCSFLSGNKKISRKTSNEKIKKEKIKKEKLKEREREWEIPISSLKFFLNSPGRSPGDACTLLHEK